MDMMTEKELSRVRLRFIDVIKSFFFEEPDAEKMSRWRGIFASLHGTHINPLFDAAVADFCKLLTQHNLSDLQDEYYVLFTDPFNKRHIATTASYYVDGRHHGETLAQFRGLLAKADLMKDESVIDAEDSIAVMLDSLARLIEDEVAGSTTARDYQTQLVVEFLEPLVESVYQVLKEDDRADFYETCGLFLKGYLDLERGLIMEM